MKKKTISIFLVILLFLITGCGNEKQLVNNNDNNNAQNNDKEIIIDKQLVEIFNYFSDKIGIANFDDCFDYVKNSNYEYMIIDPQTAIEDDILAEIKIYSNDTQNVYLSFYPKNEQETLALLCYNNNEYELSIGNDYHTTKIKYEAFDRILKKSISKSNVDELLEYIIK